MYVRYPTHSRVHIHEDRVRVDANTAGDGSLYLHGYGNKVTVSGSRLHVDGETGHTEVPLDRLGRIFLFGQSSVTSPAFDALLARRVDVHHLTVGGRLKGVTTAPDPVRPLLRREQYRRFDDRDWSLDLARGVVSAKITNQRALLLRYRRRGFLPWVTAELGAMRVVRRQVPNANDLDQLMGFEGAAARSYWRAFAGLVDPLWNFGGRHRQPPPDPVNSLLSFAYSLMSAEVETAVRATGLDVGYGFLHAPQDGRPSLALDLMEEFRPVVGDAVALTCVNTGRLQPGHFLFSDTGGHTSVHLTAEGRRRFFTEYERRMTTEFRHRASGRVVTYREALFLQAAHLARVVVGDFPRYEPVTWS